MPGVHGLALSMHHGPLKPPLQEVAGQPDCSVAHAPPSSGLVQVARHSHVERICAFAAKMSVAPRPSILILLAVARCCICPVEC